MERAERNDYCAAILAVVLLLAPQLSFARGMSGGAAGWGLFFQLRRVSVGPHGL
jgi:hypothetical protein